MEGTGSREIIRIGVYIPTECQLIDMACIDIFGSLSHEYFTIIGDTVPAPIANLAPSVQIFCTYTTSL